MMACPDWLPYFTFLINEFFQTSKKKNTAKNISHSMIISHKSILAFQHIFPFIHSFFFIYLFTSLESTTSRIWSNFSNKFYIIYFPIASFSLPCEVIVVPFTGFFFPIFVAILPAPTNQQYTLKLFLISLFWYIMRRPNFCNFFYIHHLLCYVFRCISLRRVL